MSDWRTRDGGQTKGEECRDGLGVRNHLESERETPRSKGEKGKDIEENEIKKRG